MRGRLSLASKPENVANNSSNGVLTANNGDIEEANVDDSNHPEDEKRGKQVIFGF